MGQLRTSSHNLMMWALAEQAWHDVWRARAAARGTAR
jgi:hypothetical protein